MDNALTTRATLTVTRPAYNRQGIGDRGEMTVSKPTAGIARCQRKGCKAALRVDGYAWRAWRGYGRYERRIDWPVVVCSCGREYPMIREIRGTVTECPCDGRCTSAKGPNCECSCGGKNHGSGL